MQATRSGETYGTARLVERQMLLWNVRQRAIQESPTETFDVPYRFVTISRDMGSLGNEIANDLSHRIGWHVYDREIVDNIAEHGHVRQSLVEQLDEKSRNLVHDTVQRLLAMSAGETFGVDDYHGALVKTLVILGTRGEAILMGRGANFVLRNHPGLHVRIVASPDVRILRLCQRWWIKPSEAQQRIEQLDTERRQFIRRLFRQDLDDHHSYDIVFNTDHMAAKQVVDSIHALLSRKGNNSS